MSIGLYDMGKRKLESYTEREVVSHWFEGSDEGTYCFTVMDDSASSHLATDTIEGPANRDSTIGDKAPWACVASGRGRGTANVDQLHGQTSPGTYGNGNRLPEPARGEQTQRGTVSACSWTTETGHVQPVRPTLAAEAIRWLEPSQSEDTEPRGDPVGPSVEGDDSENNATVEAFWALLKRAGYEEI